MYMELHNGKVTCLCHSLSCASIYCPWATDVDSVAFGLRCLTSLKLVDLHGGMRADNRLSSHVRQSAVQALANSRVYNRKDQTIAIIHVYSKISCSRRAYSKRHSTSAVNANLANRANIA